MRKTRHFVIDREDLPKSATAFRFEGNHYGDTNVSFFLTETPSGRGPGLHVHPYNEVFIVLRGNATFTVGDTLVGAEDGQIVVVPAGVQHKYVNSGTETLRLIAIHPASRITQTFLETKEVKSYPP